MREAPLPRDRRRHADAGLHGAPASATCPATCSATACCCRGTSACWPRSITATSSSTRTRTPRRASPSARACSTCRARAGTTTTARRSRAAAASTRAARSPSRCRRGAQRCSGLESASGCAQRAHPRHPAHAGRPAVERRHRHLREGERRVATPTSATAPTMRVRVNGSELRAKVVGEGGNLGLHAARARRVRAARGGRLNTDFIDNSAGVNTSDVEVNIKILLNPLMHDGQAHARRPQPLLARMTDEVAALVLRNNYLQSQAISTLELQSAARLPEYPAPDPLARALRRAEPRARVPADGRRARRAAQERRRAHAPGAGDRARLQQDLAQQPPARLRRAGRSVLVDRAGALLPGADAGALSRAPSAHHRLRREIIATATTNSLVNRMGPAFVTRAQEDTGAEPARDRARLHRRARDLRHARRVGAHRGARQQGAPRTCSTG